MLLIFRNEIAWQRQGPTTGGPQKVINPFLGPEISPCCGIHVNCQMKTELVIFRLLVFICFFSVHMQTHSPMTLRCIAAQHLYINKQGWWFFFSHLGLKSLFWQLFLEKKKKKKCFNRLEGYQYFSHPMSVLYFLFLTLFFQLLHSDIFNICIMDEI